MIHVREYDILLPKLILGFIIICVIIILTLIVLFYFKLTKTINSLKTIVETNLENTFISSYVIRMLYISGVISSLAGIMIIVTIEGINALVSRVAFILFAITLKRYLKNIKKVSYERHKTTKTSNKNIPLMSYKIISGVFMSYQQARSCLAIRKHFHHMYFG